MKQRLRDLEAKENWLAARIDELLDDACFVETWEFQGNITLRDYAKRTAEREHAAITANLEEAIIDSGVHK